MYTYTYTYTFSFAHALHTRNHAARDRAHINACAVTIIAVGDYHTTKYKEFFHASTVTCLLLKVLLRA